MAATFQGFRHEALQFLLDLALNNDRAWFQPRKAEYERLLKEPLAALCTDLAGELVARNVPLGSDPARSPFRIYRDVRFSADKSPYKTAASASFPWVGAGGGVGGYFHLEPGRVFVGGGMWHPSPARLKAWRTAVVSERDRVHEILDERAFREAFGSLDGDRLSRTPAGFPTDDPDVDLLRLKDVTFGHRLADADVASPELPARIASILEVASPLLAFLAGLPGAEERAGWLRT